jgi:hypothetical protein
MKSVCSSSNACWTTRAVASSTSCDSAAAPDAADPLSFRKAAISSRRRALGAIFGMAA